ncbi:MAG: M48 family metallopeptidase [Myxococcales bacterium]|nr:MAG: M48 family metallopeptidase [Myxococcales bacterium]
MHAFSGGVFSDSLERGRSVAKLQIKAEGICAETETQSFMIPYSELHAEVGGASGKMVFCRNAERSVTVYSEERGFLSALARSSKGPSQKQLQTLVEAMARKSMQVKVGWSILGVVAFALSMAVFVIVVKTSWLKDAIPTQVDKELGKVGMAQMRGDLPLSDAKVARDALEVILKRLEPLADPKGRWKFDLKLVDRSMVNAFALPGGQMIVFRGLVQNAEHPDEVAAVLAHEMSHVTRRHGVTRLLRSVGIVGVVEVLVGDVGGVLAMAKELLTLSTINNYSRVQESEADADAIRIMHQAGLDPFALARFFERLEKKQGDIPDYLEWMSSHPSHKERIKAVERYRPKTSFHPKELAIDWDAVQASFGKMSSTKEEKAVPKGKENGS